MSESSTTFDYGVLTAEELVEHLIDENGLVAFLDAQQKGEPYERWDWWTITRDLQAFSHGLLTFSPGYLQELYELQRSRLAAT